MLILHNLPAENNFLQGTNKTFEMPPLLLLPTGHAHRGGTHSTYDDIEFHNYKGVMFVSLNSITCICNFTCTRMHEINGDR